MDAATKRSVDLGLNEDEVAFYDALAANESAVTAMRSVELRASWVEALCLRDQMRASGAPPVATTRPMGFR